MPKFYVYNAATREYLISFTATDLAAAEAKAARYYSRGGQLTLRVAAKRLGAPWLTAAASHRARGERLLRD